MHNRHLKIQCASVFLVFILMSIFSVFVSTAFHKILIGADRVPTYYPIKECIQSIRTVEKHRLLFLIFEGFSFCLAAALMVSYSRNYISKLQCITPQIYTPVAAGQNQFGSARWMKEKEKAKAFETIIINTNDRLYELLIEAGKEDRAVIKKHVIDREDKQEQKRVLFSHIKQLINKLLPEDRRCKFREKLWLRYDEMLKKYFPSIWQREQQKSVERVVNLFDWEFDIVQKTDPEVDITAEGSVSLSKPETNSISGGGKNEIEKLVSRLPFDTGGMVIGMKRLHGGKELFYFIEDDTHLLCIGATRSGKSRTLVIQSICFLALAGESMIISDLKGELNQYTGTFLKRLGYNVIVLDFKNPLKSDRYNLLQPIIDAIDEDNIPKATECVWDLVGILVGEAKGEKIWNNGEASTIACAIMSVVYDNREGERRKYQTLTNVYYFIAEMCKPVGKKIPIVEYVKELPDNHPAKPLVAISEIAPERTRGSFYTAALTTLKLFTSSYINAMTMTSDYNPKDLGRKKTALFMVLPDERTTYYSIAYLQAYQNIYANKGAMTPGIDGITLDGFGDQRTLKLIESLKDHSYQPTSVKRVYIPKKNGKKRPLGIASSDDKLVQEIVRMMLESIYEPTFSNFSHGFRAKRSCHTALLQIQHNFTGIKWFVEGDIKAYFDTIDHHMLMGILRKRIKDEAFLELIWKFLRAGYLEKWEYNATYSGVAQGSGFSPILANIYLNELDKYVEEYMQKLNCRTMRRNGKEYGKLHGRHQRYNEEHRKIWHTLSDGEKKTALKEIKRLRKEFLSVPSKDPMVMAISVCSTLVIVTIF
ncbi:MAG TPA: reverse transcriptase domain-containing protein [Ruminiclostridium sp.]|nr:reverse transcriptase domain-containing protein [Ruminiclostridium sp.]